MALGALKSVCNEVQHRVRGRNGKMLTKIELSKELHKFIHVALIAISERFPFYDDFSTSRVKGQNPGMSCVELHPEPW